MKEGFIVTKKRIVILGGGFAGQLTATEFTKVLAPGEADITMVNKHNYHFVTSKLHETAAGNISDNAITIDIKTELLKPEYVKFRKDTVVSINKEEKKVQLENGELEYDILIAALGAEPQTFGIPGVWEHGSFIWTLNSSAKAREKMIENCQKWHEDQDDSRLHFVCVGAGLTGMEWVGEMIERRKKIAKEYNVPLEKLKVTCIDAMPKILPFFPDETVKYTVEFCKKHNITLRPDCRVESVDEKTINLVGGEKIPTQNVIWAAGVTGNSIIHAAGFPEVRNTKRVKVDYNLQVEGWEDHYVIGDASISINPDTGEEYGPTAQVALQQGVYLAKHIANKMHGKQTKKPFKMIYRGTMMSLGNKNAAGLVYGVKTSGMIGHMFKKIIELRYYWEVKGTFMAIKMLFKK